MKPRSSWHKMTPEFPRAPMSEPWAMALHTAAMWADVVGASTAYGAPGAGSGSRSPRPSSSASSPTTDSTVSAMFVPVSPSGTG